MVRTTRGRGLTAAVALALLVLGSSAARAQGGADLAVSMTASADSVFVGDTFTYTLTVTNGGPEAAPDVQVHDSLPASVALVGVASTAGSCDGAAAGAIVCALGLVPTSLASPPVHIAITVRAISAGDATNAAVVSGGVLDPNPSNNSASIALVIQQHGADLAIAKTASAAQVVVGDDFTYTLTLTNNGPETVASAHVSDQLPAQVSFVSITHPNAGCGLFQSHLDCFSDPIASGQSFVVATVTVHTVAAGQIVNTALVTSGVADPVPGNNASTVTVFAREKQADLSISKTASAAQVVVGDDFTYSLTVTNNGPDAVPSAHVSDQLPAQVSFVSITHPNAGCGLFQSHLDCFSDPIASGQSLLVATVTVHTVASGQITNTAMVTSGLTDPVPGNNASTVVVSARDKQADLAITKTASAAQVFVGNDFTYTITVTNNGPDSVPSAHITDVLPAQIGFVSITHPNAACGLIFGILDCITDPIASGQSLLVASFVVHTLAAGQITNTASVTSGLVDLVPGNNASTVVVSASNFQIFDLMLQVQGFALPHGIETSLLAKLDAASSGLASGDLTASCGALGAFGNQVRAQSGKMLTADQASTLDAGALAVKSTDGCE